MKKAAEKILDTQLGKLGQNAYMVRLVELCYGPDIHSLRVQIRSDTVPGQNYAKVERFDGTEWKPLASILAPLMKTDQSLAYSREALTAAAFLEDYTYLMKLARLTLLTK